MSEMNDLNMNLSAVRPPIAFAAKNARFVSNFPQGSDELWMADLKACRHDVQSSQLIIMELSLYSTQQGRAPVAVGSNADIVADGITYGMGN